MNQFSKLFAFFEDDTYRGWRRVSVHILMWAIILVYITIQTPNNFLEKNPTIFHVFALRDFLTTFLCFYLVAYLALPLLFDGRWILFVSLVFFTYLFIHFTMYITLDYLNNRFPHSRTLSGYAADYLAFSFVRGLFAPYVFWFNSFWISQFFIIPLVLKFIKDISISQIKNARLEKENIRLELDFLKSQVNPHFLFNTLNNIYSLIVDKEPKAAEITMKLSDLMRFSLYESSTDKILLNRELKFIKDYVELEQVRHNKHVKISVDIEGDTESLLIPPFILITFVENAFKHGINSTIRASWVKIVVRIHKKVLNFIIENSKPTHLIHDKTQGGIGVWNVQKRLEMLYPNRHTLKINNNSTTFHVNLTIHLYE